MILEIGSTTDTTINFYCQKADDLDSYDKVDSVRYSMSGASSFNMTSRFTGMKPVAYAWTRDDNEPASSAWIPATEGSDTSGTNTGHLHIKYDRVTNDIVFVYESRELKTVSGIQYGRSIAEYQSQTPDTSDFLADIPDGYYFAGWFEDPEYSTPMNWNATMPLGNKIVYAALAPEKYHVMIDANEGIVDEHQSLNFKVPYQTVIDDSYLKNATREGYTLVGWYTDEAMTKPWNFETKLTRDSLVVEYSGIDDPARETYGDAGDISTVGVLTLYARWRDDSVISSGGLHIRYINPEGAPEWSYNDPLAYTDQADVTAVAAPTSDKWPEGKQFDGWQLGSETYFPAQTFVADKSDAVNKGTEENPNLVITLTATYKDIETHTPTHIYWYSNYGSENDGKGELYQEDAPLHINEAVDIYSAPSREGYEFRGWTKTKGGSTASIRCV